MYYELVILSILMRTPTHGYWIVKIVNDQIGPWAKISSGTLYTILAKLERETLIEQLPVESRSGSTSPNTDVSSRQARTCRITDSGRVRFKQLMLDTASGLGDYQRIFYHKAVYSDLVSTTEWQFLVNHYVNYCHAGVLHVESEMAAIQHELAGRPGPRHLQNILGVMRHLLDNWQAELVWARSFHDAVANSNQNTFPPA